MAMEKPSASKFAKPSIIIIDGERDAPTTPVTIANVDTAPSIAPYTKFSTEYCTIQNYQTCFKQFYVVTP